MKNRLEFVGTTNLKCDKSEEELLEWFNKEFGIKFEIKENS